jgi:hypothetical protein
LNLEAPPITNNGAYYQSIGKALTVQPGSKIWVKSVTFTITIGGGGACGASNTGANGTGESGNAGEASTISLEVKYGYDFGNDNDLTYTLTKSSLITAAGGGGGHYGTSTLSQIVGGAGGTSPDNSVNIDTDRCYVCGRRAGNSAGTLTLDSSDYTKSSLSAHAAFALSIRFSVEDPKGSVDGNIKSKSHDPLQGKADIANNNDSTNVANCVLPGGHSWESGHSDTSKTVYGGGGGAGGDKPDTTARAGAAGTVEFYY